MALNALSSLAQSGNASLESAEPAVAAAAAHHEAQAMLTQAAVKFEAFFVAQMLKQMRQTTAAMAGEDSALNHEVNQAPLAMADDAVAQMLSTRGAFGIADVLVRQMSGPPPSPPHYGSPVAASRNLT